MAGIIDAQGESSRGIAVHETVFSEIISFRPVSVQSRATPFSYLTKKQRCRQIEEGKLGMAKPTLLTVDDDPNGLKAIERDLRARYGEKYRVDRKSTRLNSSHLV